MTGGTQRNRWKPYTRESIAQAFNEWARLHDGKAPTKRDWSPERDPESLWPRPAGESFIAAVKEMAHADGINLNRRAPHKNDPEHLARRAWREAQSFGRLADGRLESSQGSRGQMEAVVSTAIENSPGAAIQPPHSRPRLLPTGGHRLSPLEFVRRSGVVEAVGRSYSAASASSHGQLNGTTPLPSVACVSR